MKPERVTPWSKTVNCMPALASQKSEISPAVEEAIVDAPGAAFVVDVAGIVDHARATPAGACS